MPSFAQVLAGFAAPPLAALLAATAGAQGFGTESLQPGWLPTELGAGESYVGSARCIQCHPEQGSALGTAMGDALHRAEESAFLAGGEHRLAIGPFSYRIADGVYEVSTGAESLRAPILWSFGHGKAGQTYVLRLDGELYESRVSYFDAIGGLDQTLGAPAGSVPASLSEAFGRRMTGDDVRGCFGCHATGAVVGGRVALDRLVPGIQCEGCHGPGNGHLAALADIGAADLGIRSLVGLGAEQESEFCGSCHRTWSQIVLEGLRGPPNVRFQPYRIANSPCYDAEDPRIRCSACHDPHEDPIPEPSAYDSRCVACHQPARLAQSAEAPECSVGNAECTSCHMPKVEIPGSHYLFTDHFIRVARPGDPYPE